MDKRNLFEKCFRSKRIQVLRKCKNINKDKRNF